MRTVWGSFVALTCLLTLAPPAAAQVLEWCISKEGDRVAAWTCGEGNPYAYAWTQRDTDPSDGLDMGGNATACTGASEAECWEGPLRAAVTLEWEAHVLASEQSFREKPGVCAEAPFPVPVGFPVEGLPPGFWDSTGTTICINDTGVHFNQCAPIWLDARDKD